MRISQSLQRKLSKIKVLALDCDGVLTTLFIDTGVIMTKKAAQQYTGRDFEYVFESARFSHKDGQGVDLIKRQGVSVFILTTQRSGYVQARAWKLGIPIVRNQDKIVGLKTWLKEYQPKVRLSEVAFVGDSVNDIPVMQIVGFSACVGDGAPEAKKLADYVTHAVGGDGAVREVCNFLLQAKTKK